MENLSVGASVLLTGIVVVFFTLIILIFVIIGYSKIIVKGYRKKNPIIEKNLKSGSISNTKIKNEIPNEVISAISAAIYYSYGSNAKIYSVSCYKKSQQISRSLWQFAGRMENTRAL